MPRASLRHGASLRVTTVARAVLGGALLIVGCQQRAAPDPGAAVASASRPLTWSVGLRHPYRLALTTDLRVTGDDDPVRLVLEGTLQVEANSSTSGPTQLVLLLTEPVLTSPGDPAADHAKVAEGLKRPILVTLASGRLTEIRTAPDLEPLAVGMIRTLAAAFQFEEPGTARGTWVAEEEDAAGVYDVEYRSLGDGKYARKKLRYRPLSKATNAALPMGLELTPEIVASSGTLEVVDGLLRRRETKDELRAVLAAAADARSTTEVRLEILGPAVPVQAPLRWAELEGLLRPIASGPPRPSDRLQLDAAKTEGFTFAGVLQELEATASGPTGTEPLSEGAKGKAVLREGQLVSALAAFLRQDESRVATVIARIRANSPATRRLLEALSAAGTPGSQQALADLALDKSLGVRNRELAVHSLIRTSHPTVASVGVLREMVKDPKLRQYGVLGLGTFCRELRAQGNQVQADGIARELGELLATATSRTDRVLLLRAVANSGHPSLLERARPYLADPDETVRAAAVEAIRLMKGPEVDALVIAALGDERAVVRRAALNSAKVRDPGPELRTAVGDAGRNAPDSGTRKDAVLLLERWLPKFPELRATLEGIAAGEKDATVRRLAEKALGK